MGEMKYWARQLKVQIQVEDGYIFLLRTQKRDFFIQMRLKLH